MSQGGGTERAWGPSGHELFYRTVSDTAPQLMVATIRAQPSLVVSRRALFSIADLKPYGAQRCHSEVSQRAEV